jgi:hypothetical protein
MHMCECPRHAIARWKRVSRRNTDWQDTRQSRWRHACLECGRPGDLLQPQRASRPSSPRAGRSIGCMRDRDALLRPFTTTIELAVASHTAWKHVLLSALCSISECSVDGVDICRATKGAMIGNTPSVPAWPIRTSAFSPNFLPPSCLRHQRLSQLDSISDLSQSLGAERYSNPNSRR